MEIDKDNLEKALDKESTGKSMAKETKIGFHRGAISTLINERNELVKMIQNVEIIIQAHIKRLEEMGVEIKKA